MNPRFLCVALLLAACGCSERNPRVKTAINQEASLPASLPMNPLEGKVITTWVDRERSTMSTLFGNDAVVERARAGAAPDYPAGSVLSLVTWRQKEDLRWFGGNIPGALESVEFVRVGTGPDQRPSYTYQKYEGAPLKQAEPQPGPDNARVAYLLSQRAAFMP